jgi:hypothetical protein
MPPGTMRSAMIFGALALFGLVSCGGDALTMPEDISIVTYKKDTPFTLTVIMKSCADTCATYTEPSCSVEYEGDTILLDVEIAYDRNSDQCTERCQGQVLLHCDVRGLSAGTYTIESGSFRKTINVI